MHLLVLIAQPSNFLRLPKQKLAPGGYDTVGLKNATKIAEETQGVIEKTIDPETYIVGPNDVITVGINGPQPLSFDIFISPDAKVLVPSVQAIDVKGLSFAKAQEKIITAVKAVYRGQSVDVILKKLKTFKVSLLRAVRKPMVVGASSSDRVSEVIDRAGGLLWNASLRKIRVEREGGKQPKRRYTALLFNG